MFWNKDFLLKSLKYNDGDKKLRVKSMTIYLDYAATTMPDRDIYKEMENYFFQFYANPSSEHYFGKQAREILENERASLAEALCITPSEVIFCSSGTEANNLALLGSAYGNCHKGKHIVSTTTEHKSVLAPLAKLEMDGFKVTYLHVDSNGILNFDDLKCSLTDDTIMVSILIVNNETGIIQPHMEISKIIRSFNENIIIHYDLVAGFPKIIKKFNQLDANLITVSGHKLYAPKGIAMLYIKSGTRLIPQMLGGEQEFGKRAGTENFFGAVFMCKSIKKCIKEIDNELHRLNALRDYFETKLLEKYNDNVLITGKNTARIPHILNVCFRNKQRRKIIKELSKLGIYISGGSACKSGEDQPSYVICAMGIPESFAQGCVRFSFGRYTTAEELNYTLSKIYEIIKY